MFIYEPMMPEDVHSLDLANLDRKSENFTLDYYFSYVNHHPNDFFNIRSLSPSLIPRISDMIYNNPILAYIFGKREYNENLCFHLSANSVAPSYRAMKLGSALLNMFEKAGDYYKAYFVDLYVRASNMTAIRFYEKNGYSCYRRIFAYYSYPDGDAFDMRKSIGMDPTKELMFNGTDIHSESL